MNFIFGKTKIRSCFFKFIIRAIFTLLIVTAFSCAGMGSRPETASPDETKNPSSSLPREAYTNFILGSIHLSKGEYIEAKGYISKALKADPDSIYLNKKMALVLVRLNDMSNALKYARRCIEIDPEDIGSHILLAEIYGSTGDTEAAKSEHKKILEIDPGQLTVLITLHLKNKKYQDAFDLLHEAISRDPENAIVHYYIGRVNAQLGNLEEAESSYIKTLEINGTMQSALFDLASIYQTQKKDEKAISAYEKLLDYYPGDITAFERLMGLYLKHGNNEKFDQIFEETKKRFQPRERHQRLGLLYLEYGQLDKSIYEFELIVSGWPEDYESRYFLAVAYEKNRELAKALECLQLIPKESAYFVKASIQIAYIHESEGNYDLAFNALLQAIEAYNQEIEPYLFLASLYESLKEYEKAGQILNDAFKLNKETERVLFRQGVVLDKSGDRVGAIEKMRTLLEINPDHADAMNYIGYTYAEMDINLDEALELVQKAAEISPESAYITDSLGWIYFKMGEIDKALTLLQEARSILPDDPEISEHLGDLYLQRGEYQRSLEMYRQALSNEHPSEEKIRKKINDVKKFLKQ